MNALAILIDTDVLLDFLIDRDPFSTAAKKLILKSQEKIFNAYLAAHSVTNIFYILRKIYSVSERKQYLRDLCKSISVVEIDHELILSVLANVTFDDIEDCLQAECAEIVHADYIVTRNIDDYTHSAVPAILPERFLQKLKA